MMLEESVRQHIRRIIKSHKLDEAVKHADPYEYLDMLEELSKHTTVFIGIKISAFDQNARQLEKLGLKGASQQIVRISALAVLPDGETKKMEEYVALGPTTSQLYATNIAQLKADIASGITTSDPKRAWLNLYRKFQPYSPPDVEEKSGVKVSPTGRTYKKSAAAEEIQQAKYPFSRLELAKNPELASLEAYKGLNPLYQGEVGALVKLKLFLKSLPGPLVFVMNGATFHMKHLMSRANQFHVEIPKPIRVIDTHTMVRYFSTPLLKQRAAEGDELAKDILSKLGNSPAIRKVINALGVKQDNLDSEDVEMLARVFKTLKDIIKGSLLSGFKYSYDVGEFTDPKTGEIKSRSYSDPKTGEVFDEPSPEVSYAKGSEIAQKRAEFASMGKKVSGRFNPSEKAKKLGASYLAQAAGARQYDSPEERAKRAKIEKAEDAERLELNKQLFATELERLKEKEVGTKQGKEAEKAKKTAEKKFEKELAKSLKKSEKIEKSGGSKSEEAMGDKEISDFLKKLGL